MVTGDVIRLGYEKNKIESGRKNGQAVLRVDKKGCLTEVIAVEVTPISGAIIQNQYGFLALGPNLKTNAQFELMDKHGRVFVHPLSSLNLEVSSSNPEVLTPSVSDNSNTITLHAHRSGICLLTLQLPGHKVYD